MIIALLLGLFLIGGSVLMGTALHGRAGDRAVAEFDGYPISDREMDFYRELVRSDVLNYYQANYEVNALEHPDDAYDGMTPGQKWEEMALARLQEDKCLMILGYEQGLIGFADFTSFEDAWNSENKARAAAVQNGEIVYGMTSFTEEEYLAHFLANLRIALEKQLSASEGDSLYVTEEEIRTAYEADQTLWDADATTLCVTDYYVMQSDDLTALEEVRESIMSGMDAEPSDAVNVREWTFTGDSYSADYHRCYEIRSAADEMAEGELREVMDEIGYHLIYLASKEVDHEAAYESYRETIRSYVLDTKFQVYYEQELSKRRNV